MPLKALNKVLKTSRSKSSYKSSIFSSGNNSCIVFNAISSKRKSVEVIVDIPFSNFNVKEVFFLLNGEYSSLFSSSNNLYLLRMFSFVMLSLIFLIYFTQ